MVHAPWRRTTKYWTQPTWQDNFTTHHARLNHIQSCYRKTYRTSDLPLIWQNYLHVYSQGSPKLQFLSRSDNSTGLCPTAPFMRRYIFFACFLSLRCNITIYLLRIDSVSNTFTGGLDESFRFFFSTKIALLFYTPISLLAIRSSFPFL